MKWGGGGGGGGGGGLGGVGGGSSVNEGVEESRGRREAKNCGFVSIAACLLSVSPI